MFYESADGSEIDNASCEGDIVCMAKIETEIDDEPAEDDDDVEPQKPPLRYTTSVIEAG